MTRALPVLDGASPGTVPPGPGLGLAGPSLARDLELAAEGWRRRFVGAPPRLQEMVSLYESIGQEVRTEPLTGTDLGRDCQGCTLALSVFRIVYTRVRA